ncbi:YraN family protein [Lusitaniella coriacea LEGE 07157]|uniref:UPF0102 protein IQ249_23115 n=1 Tax=Lusitaniella coriacea LEGE 07157 TaxID=945747 RepID=A0A8J7IXI6_9CYAN|nr:YraN family protein [Lusitaniella coriacea]MBE9118783.1 YraN family protein [Lusitaniella coriacea LEGE 07157]
MANIGELGEQAVAQWLEGQGWEILHRRWHSRWGEVDVIAWRDNEKVAMGQEDAALIFVEVKTRGSRSWDEGGLCAIAPRKQAKLWRTAEVFLSKYPAFASLPCRFDLALVRYRLLTTAESRSEEENILSAIAPSQSIRLSGYEFSLHDYIPDIFVGV